MAVPGTIRSGRSVSSWTIFSGVLLLIAGVMHLLTGIAAIAERAVFVVDEDEIFRISLTGWGWLHVVIAALLLIAGVGIVNGKSWGYLGGIVMAALSVLANFIFAPMYPFWALVIIAIDVLVIWALARQLAADDA
ncbi:DUF7144 family membrane protein [Nocardia thraciensis]